MLVRIPFLLIDSSFRVDIEINYPAGYEASIKNYGESTQYWLFWKGNIQLDITTAQGNSLISSLVDAEDLLIVSTSIIDPMWVDLIGEGF